ncbi:MAG: lipoate--protein ligase family protein [Ignavibacteria bacterium]|nr:lipoate--protein ligase family protein [Ignavibacteria bacterium]
MKWQFLDSGFASGEVNMARDGQLAQDLLNGGEICTLRVYGWNPPAISLGRNQSLDSIDLEKAKHDQLDIVRRVTGGRAILHSEELTYSVTMLSAPKTVLAEYRLISQGLVAGLRLLRADVTLESAQPHLPLFYREAASGACYASATQYEITVGGKKLVGSAQRRFQRGDGMEVVLQHGSILLGPDHRRIANYLNVARVTDRQTLEEIMQARTADLSAAIGRSVSYSEVAHAVRRGFELALSIEFDNHSLGAAVARPLHEEIAE